MKKYYNLGKHALFPICRSITGSGVRKTLKIIQKEFPGLKIKSIKSGTKAFDWTVPPEWNVSDAYIADKNGLKIIDFKENNLHLFGYSTPLKKTFTKKNLFKNLYFLRNQPNAIPYITSYYKKRWGFCLSYNEFKRLDQKYSLKDKFKVVINARFKENGNLNYGELILNGKSKQEILISTYICHPSMANNELSGPIVSMGLINYFRKKKLNKTLRFIFIPETIGSISYLNINLTHLKKNIIGGYNLSCIGDDRQHSCMFSKYKNSPSDEAIILAYRKLKINNYKVYSFLKRGSDERQYNSPGVDLKISSIFRTKYAEYPEYHTSLDDFNLVTLKGVTGGYNITKTAIEIMLKNIYPKYKIVCEPQMSKRGLYPTLSTKNKSKLTQHFMNFLQYADGYNSLEKISSLIKLDLKSVQKIYLILRKNSLI
jgi:aminopeptidase-like protein|tara:strand:- start:12 stop:1292 length:1281 start_codon:yes stop_codon:yes gene_type:complete